MMPLPSSNVRQGITLSRQEMRIISQTISRDFSPRLFASRVGRQTKSRFTPQELLEISQQISREYAPNKVSHQARLVLLAVSPRRLHVYWHTAKRLLKETSSRLETVQPMTLRIYTDTKQPMPPSEQSATEQPWFDVIVNSLEGQQDIWLSEPLASASGIHYRAALGEITEQHVFTPQVYSNATLTPHTINLERGEELPIAMAQFIMQPNNTVSLDSKSASGQGK